MYTKVTSHNGTHLTYLFATFLTSFPIHTRLSSIPSIGEPPIFTRTIRSGILELTSNQSSPSVSLSVGWQMALHCIFNGSYRPLPPYLLKCSPVTPLSTFSTNPRGFSRNLTTFEEYCSAEGTLPRVLSKTYNLLNSPIEQPDLHCLKHWETGLQHTFTIKLKQNIIRFSLKSSICMKTQETNCKILTRWYRIPYLLHEFYPNTTDRCWRCQAGKLLQIFWSCPKIKHYWKEVRRIAQEFTDFEIPADPAFFLLHISFMPENIYEKCIIRHLPDATKSCIPFELENPHSPIRCWL